MESDMCISFFSLSLFWENTQFNCFNPNFAQYLEKKKIKQENVN